MWTDQELDQYAYDPEADPRLAHWTVILYVLAAVASTIVTIVIVLRSPMHG
jgi:hypothetical protein